MANHTIDNPVGIDKAIQRLQNDLFNDLGWSKLEVYARIYKTETSGKDIPQPYLNNGQYLKDAFINDKSNAHIFFDVDDVQSNVSGPKFECKVKIIFMVNLKNLFPSVIHRADSECQSQAWELVYARKEFDIINIETGLKKVFNGYDLSGIKKLDTQPYHVFAINTKLKYHINN
ncbi:hypothetical protein [uncultured Wocania sp.]|uniref:hypothetical protein n=1 Tax=uncultured Wocania sp. TaxID=2834404 RepID=UPI0030F974D2